LRQIYPSSAVQGHVNADGKSSSQLQWLPAYQRTGAGERIFRRQRLTARPPRKFLASIKGQMGFSQTPLTVNKIFKRLKNKKA
jgi:hypothetical protein